MHSSSLSIPVTAVLVLTGLLYWRAWVRLQTAFPERMPAWRAIAFLGGLLCLWLAVGSPFAGLDQELLTAHMVQHLLLMTIGPPLILLGSPVLAHGFPKIDPFLNLAPVQNLGAILTNLVFCWFAAAAVLIGWHIPAAFELGRGSEFWHQVEHVTFLIAGLLFWGPVIPFQPSVSPPRWSIVLYLFMATLPCDALSAFLAFCGRVVYTSYLHVPRHFNLSPLQDQECAGALMWTCATFAYLIPAVLITARLLSLSPVHERRSLRTTSE